MCVHVQTAVVVVCSYVRKCVCVCVCKLLSLEYKFLSLVCKCVCKCVHVRALLIRVFVHCAISVMSQCTQDDDDHTSDHSIVSGASRIDFDFVEDVHF